MDNLRQPFAAAFCLAVLSAPAGATAKEVRSTVAVSVQVVDSCLISANQAGLNTRCSASAKPIVTTGPTLFTVADQNGATQTTRIVTIEL